MTEEPQGNAAVAGQLERGVRPLQPERTDTQRLAAILLATPEALQELLQLPLGAYIDSVYVPHDRPGMLELRIRGAGWACDLGQTIPRTSATVTLQRDADGRELARVVDWGLPSSHERPNVRAKLPAEAGAVSLVRDDAPCAADQAYSACRSGSA